MERGGGQQLAEFLELLAIGHRFFRERHPFVPGQSVENLLFDIDEAEIFHDRLPM
jgi:hypothetical protein